MATIAVRVGQEIKEISGLTKSTKCSDVVLALLREKVASDMSESSAGPNENMNNSNQEVSETAVKSIKELAPSYAIVENWRGCEKPIPPRTRILNVWQAWGKEQKHVELSLKKSKNIRFRDGSHHVYRNPGGKPSERNDVDKDHSSLHNMSSHQKRKIRRNMRQYHRALMMKQSENCAIESEEINLQSEKIEVKPDSKIEKRNKIITSEETFIDGFLADPECLIRRADRARLIDQGTFNREFCKYRRRNRGRHGSSNSRQHRRHQVSHYPYSSQHDKPRSSRKGLNNKSRKCRYSSDDSSASSMSNTSEYENASDADDEKSVLVDMRSNTPRRNVPYNIGMRGDTYSATTGTDSSTTTSGDSLISSLGGSTSSETSSGGDYFLPEMIPPRLSYVKAMDDAKAVKPTQNSSIKPKKNKFILKPAFNLIESFRKPSKRKSNKKSEEKLPPIPDVKSTPATQNAEKSPQTPKISTSRKNSDSDATVKRNEPEQTESKVNVKKATEQTSPVQNAEPKEPRHRNTVEDDAEEHERKDEILQTIQSQEIVMRNQKNRLMETDSQIQNIENDVHSLRTRALGKNYVQDAYLSGLVDADSNGAMTSLFNGPSIPVTTSWIVDCEDADMLEQFIKLSEDIVTMQLQIAEYTRKSENILQDMQEEMWQLSTIADNTSQGRSTATKGAVMMLGISDEEDFSEDDEGHELLSVTNWQDSSTNTAVSQETADQKVYTQSRFAQLEAARADLEESLHLSQEIADELIEVDGELGPSDDLIQKKCEVLIDCFKDLAMSEEGVPQEMWEEYGEFLPPYDETTAQPQSPREMGISNANETMLTEVNTYIDATSPNPTSHCRDENHTLLPHQATIPFGKGVNYQARANISALPPWTHCDHCKIERAYHGHVNGMGNHTVMQQPHIPSYAQQPPLFSQLPLPTPINSKMHCSNNSQVRAPSTIASSLLPMLPIPGELMSADHHNDSDYEDLPDLTSMGPPDPSKSSRQIGLLEETEIYNNTDDSGNASAGSTTSFTSSDGSRNSSCDGGSPRPIPTLVDNPGLKPIFGRNSRLRGSLKGHFIFPNTFKQNNTHSDQRFQVTPLSTPTSKPKFKKPELLPKPVSLAFKKANVVDSKETETMMQQQRLIRRNSTGRRKYALDDANSQTTRDIVPNKPTKLKNVSSSFIHSNENNNHGWNRAQPKLYGTEHNQRFINNYDNDSDTGRSSLHSVDSDQIMFSETLV